MLKLMQLWTALYWVGSLWFAPMSIGQQLSPPSVPDRAVPVRTNLLSDGVEEIEFSTRTGVVYRVESSSGAANAVWRTIRRMVAERAEERFIPTEEGTRLYRVFQEDDRIQFPDWREGIDQYLNFDVWTPIKGGTYRLELYGDGVLLHSAAKAIPADGHFGVHDRNYDPADWPNAGYYDVGDWELRVTVAPADGGGPAQTRINKIGRSNPRFPVRKRGTFEDKPVIVGPPAMGVAGNQPLTSSRATPANKAPAPVAERNSVSVPPALLNEFNRFIALVKPYGLDDPIAPQDIIAVQQDRKLTAIATKTHFAQFSTHGRLVPHLLHFQATYDMSNPVALPAAKREAMKKWYQATGKWSKEDALAETYRITERLGIQLNVSRYQVDAPEWPAKNPQGETVRVTPFYKVELYNQSDSGSIQAEFRVGESGPGRLTEWWANVPPNPQ